MDSEMNQGGALGVIYARFSDVMFAAAAVGATFLVFSASDPSAKANAAQSGPDVALTGLAFTAARDLSLDDKAKNYRTSRIQLGEALSGMGVPADALQSESQNDAYFTLIADAGTDFLVDTATAARAELEVLRNRAMQGGQITQIDNARILHEQARVDYFTQLIANRTLQ